MTVSVNKKGIMSLISILICIAVVLHKTNGIAVMSVDLGSEWLKIAIVKPGVPMEIALNKESRRKTPFVVSINGNERLFSDPANVVAVKQPAKAYLYLTHLLGKKYDSPAVELYKKRFPHYKLSKDEERGTVLFEGEGEKFSVEQLIAMTLNASRQIAQNYAEHPMKDVVLTVPVYFNQAERRALLDVANMTGINVLQLMNDNTAVALNYGIFRAASFNATVKHIMFYDMGASHTTVTVVGYSTAKVKDRGYLETVPQLVVKGIGFDTNLGGLEMDFRLRDHLLKAFKANVKTSGDISKNPRAMAKLLKEARRVRQVLSANTDHMAQIEGLFEEKDFRLKVLRSELEEMCKDLFDRVDQPIKMALDAAAMTMSDIDTLMLMGGGTRIPKVQEILKKSTGKEELGKNVNTDEAAALGAVYKAADLTAGFKVKRFLVKDLNLFPVDVSFERTSPDTSEVRSISRNLYHRLNPLPQKKVMTFNKKPSDFHFNVTYGDLTFLSEELSKQLTLEKISRVNLTGVGDAHEKNVKAKPKGVKAYFNMDESAILHLEKVEAHFEKAPELVKEEEEANQSTLQKLGSTLSSFFGSSKKEEEETVEKNEEKPEEKKEEKKEEAKEEKKEEKKKEEEAPKKEEGKEEKKDEKKEEKKEEEKKEEKKEESKTTESKTTNATATNTTASVNETATNKTEKAKPVIAKESVTFLIDRHDIAVIGKETLETATKRLHEMEAADQMKLAVERAMNNLESFIFEFRDKLEDEDVLKMTSEEEREKIRGKLTATGDWLEEDGWEADEETLKGKLKDLKEVTKDMTLKLNEAIERPKALSALLSSLNITEVFFDSMTKMPHADEIYTEKDIKDLKKVHQEVKDWLMATWKKQNETSATDKPVLLTKDLISNSGKLDREIMYLINKAKYFVPKPKPKATNATASNTTKANKTESAEKKSDSDTTEKKGETESAEEPEVKKESETKEETKEEEAPTLELPSSADDSKTATDSADESKPATDSAESSAKSETTESDAEKKTDSEAKEPTDSIPESDSKAKTHDPKEL